MASEKINEQLAALATKENDISQQVQAYHRKLLKPLWDERREIVKEIPNFWSEVLGNSPFLSNPTEKDIEALENLTDFHVEFDEDRPNYRKVVATFKKNDLFKNESLVKEFTIDEENGAVIKKANIEFHNEKESNGKKRKSTKDDEDDDDFTTSLLEWFADDSEDSVQFGALLADEVFPAALELYNIDEESGDEDEIELGSDSDEEEEEEEAPKPKKAKK